MLVTAAVLSFLFVVSFWMGTKHASTKGLRSIASGSTVTTSQLTTDLMVWIPVTNESTVDINKTLHIWDASNTQTTVTFPNGPSQGDLIVILNNSPLTITFNGTFMDAIGTVVTSVVFRPGQALTWTWTGSVWQSINTGHS